MTRRLTIAVFVAVAVHVLVPLATLVHPIPNEQGFPVSMLHAAPSSDIFFYLKSRDHFFSAEAPDAFSHFLRFFSHGVEVGQFVPVLSAPVFPIVLLVFDYGPDNTIPLALTYVLLGCILSIVWLKWLHDRGLSLLWLVLFALLPHSVWFTINLGTDLLAAVFFAGFYLSYVAPGRKDVQFSWALVFLILFVLTRPNGLSLLLFFITMECVRLDRASPWSRYLLPAGGVLASIPLAVYYFPHLLAYTVGTTELTHYGHTAPEYIHGIYESLPRWLDLILSWLSLVAAKILYFFGLRPTYGDTPLLIVLIRAAPGIVFTIGFIYLVCRGSGREKFFVAIYMLPVLLGASQDRYSFPIQPILLLYAALACGRLFDHSMVFIKRSPRVEQAKNLSEEDSDSTREQSSAPPGDDRSTVPR
ncbi:MAG: hypothetical protein CMO26_24130 [Thiotrichales bacterium]|nr:hypothetical protein [Thiotrichales bacterium]